jgi:hypothetical protein
VRGASGAAPEVDVMSTKSPSSSVVEKVIRPMLAMVNEKVEPRLDRRLP